MVEINKKLLPMKAHYFLFNAGTAPVVPFMPTLVRQLGFSTVIVGTIYTVLPIVGMLVKPLFGIIADRFQRQKLLFLIFQVGVAASAAKFRRQCYKKTSDRNKIHVSVTYSIVMIRGDTQNDWCDQYMLHDIFATIA
uniref:Major facilitator superfamily associated domain-containing protein n=1 Tax=Anopheles melas TaxID=34690 RepID=A0A182U604_9DIPT